MGAWWTDVDSRQNWSQPQLLCLPWHLGSWLWVSLVPFPFLWKHCKECIHFLQCCTIGRLRNKKSQPESSCFCPNSTWIGLPGSEVVLVPCFQQQTGLTSPSAPVSLFLSKLYLICSLFSSGAERIQICLEALMLRSYVLFPPTCICFDASHSKIQLESQWPRSQVLCWQQCLHERSS